MNCIVKQADLSTRAAESGDLDKIVALLDLMGAENAVVSYNLNKARDAMAECIKNTMAFVVESGGDIIGCCALSNTTLWYSDDRILSDYVFYLHPEQRTFPAAMALINMCKRISNLLKLPLSLGIYSNVDPLRKFNLFARTMKPVGGFFIYMPEES